MRIAYFTNQYPAVSHTFIRREIDALEKLGVTVVRYALWSQDDLIHPEDRAELARTRRVFKAGGAEILRCLLSAVARHPVTFIAMLRLALTIGWRSDRGLLRHLAYAAEAAVLAEWCRRDKVEHLHAHFGTNSAAIAMLASVIGGIPYSFTAHGSEEFEKAPLLALDEKLRRAAFAVCVSSFGRSQLMRWSPPELWGKIALVHCGLDAAFIAAEASPPPDAPRFVCVGRLGEHKAQLILVEAVRLLRERGVFCSIVMVGDGPMRPLVEQAIQTANLADRITITGWAPGERVQEEIVAARALILPSFSENMPVVIMEAMALGRPVISTYIAGIPELVVPGSTGWLAPSSDAMALADAMQEALNASTEQLRTLGEAARARVRARHDGLNEAKKLVALFRNVARDGADAAGRGA